MSSLIDITDIRRDFPLGSEIVHVLKGIDLQIDKGEYVALVGSSDNVIMPVFGFLTMFIVCLFVIPLL